MIPPTRWHFVPVCAYFIILLIPSNADFWRQTQKITEFNSHVVPMRDGPAKTVIVPIMSPSTSKDPEKSGYATTKARGLADVVALESRIALVNGKAGRLLYRGYDIRDLARNASYEETLCLLLDGDLPNQARLDEVKAQLRAALALPEGLWGVLERMPEGGSPMAMLRTAVSALGLFDEEADDNSPEANYRKAIRIVARVPGIIAAIDRLRNGKDPVPPRMDCSHAHNFLYMLTGERPGEMAERAFDACLVLHAEHGLNASTFASRVIGATLSDIYSAVTGGVAALKGPLHGGANQEVMRMLLEIDRSGQRPADYVRAKLARRERIMGFGHRVYKTMDPRASILKDMAKGFGEEAGSLKWYAMSLEMMEVMEAEKGLYPNVDFFSASIYYALGIAIDLYTPIFALSRTAGWSAHLLEQWSDNKLIRPKAAYAGPQEKHVLPVEERA